METTVLSRRGRRIFQIMSIISCPSHRQPEFRIRFQPPDPGAKNECRKGSKSYLLEENLNILTNDRPNMKKATILIKNHYKIEIFQDSGVWIRIRFVLRGWIRSISDRIRNPGPMDF